MARAERVLFERLGEPAVEVGFDGSEPLVLSTNGAFEETFGIEEAELLGESLNDHIVPADDRASARDIDRTGATGEIVEREVRRRTPEGPRWFLFRSVPFTVDGEQRSYGIYVDITERKRQRQRFEELIRHSSDIISILDSSGTYLYQSPSAEETLGYDPEFLVGRSAFDYVHPEDREDLMAEFAEAVAEPDAKPKVEYRFKHADGSWLWLESVGNNQLDNPAVEGFVVNSRDITAHVEYEQELQLLKQVFTRVFRHNLRNRLNVIESNAELVAEHSAPAAEEYIEAILDEIQRLLGHGRKAQLIADVVDDRTTQPVDLSTCVARAVEPVRSESPRATIDVTVESVTVSVHPALVEAIRELVRNGIRHTREDRDPQVELCTESHSGSGTATLVVEDNAGGLREEEITVLEESRESSLEHGSGVGLWLVQWVVDRSAGELSVERTDRGSRFTIRLPLATDDIPADPSHSVV